MAAPDYPYYNTVDQIYHAEWSTAKLARLELLAESIRDLWPDGHPTRLIHVAGTGGKGSTCRYLEAAFGCVGKAGAFLSPHLFDYRERFSIGGEFATRADVSAAWHGRIQPHCVKLALRGAHFVHTFHEVSILIALALFEMHDVAWAALETSVGGRYDQTRGLEVTATALTNVGSDHANLLGAEPWQRALDKAGIARTGVPFFTSETNPKTLAVVEAVCAEAGAPLFKVGETEVCSLGAALNATGAPPVPEDALLSATFQKWNAALALAVVRHFYPELAEARLLEALAATRLLGRLWHVEEGIYADIAHNAEKMHALVGEVQARFEDLGKIVVVGMSGHRVPERVFVELAAIAKTIIVTGASYKGQDPGKVRGALDALAGDVPLMVVGEPAQALEVAKALRGAEDIVLLTGSTYMIEQMLNPDPHLRHLNATFGWRTQIDTEATGSVQLHLPKPPPPLR